jgi:hypothetical protein
VKPRPVALFLATALLLLTGAAKAPRLDALWEKPKDLKTRDLYHGPGGRALVPKDVPYAFLDEDTKGHSGGYEVRDPAGRKWDVKVGEEAQSELVLSRVLWAIGYRQPVTYYVKRWRMTGGPPHTESPPPGRFRLQSDHETDGEWAWDDNPFLDTPALKGLVVVNLLFNNWDLAASQNRIYVVEKKKARRPTRWYVVQDLGAALGKSRMALGSRNNLEHFEGEGFIEKVENGKVVFDFKGRHRGLRNDLTPADVRWACKLLAGLSHRQLDDAFRAAGYSVEERRRFVRKVEEKIRQGLELPE